MRFEKTSIRILIIKETLTKLNNGSATIPNKTTPNKNVLRSAKIKMEAIQLTGLLIDRQLLRVILHSKRTHSKRTTPMSSSARAAGTGSRLRIQGLLDAKIVDPTTFATTVSMILKNAKKQRKKSKKTIAAMKVKSPRKKKISTIQNLKRKAIPTACIAGASGR